MKHFYGRVGIQCLSQKPKTKRTGQVSRQFFQGMVNADSWVEYLITVRWVIREVRRWSVCQELSILEASQLYGKIQNLSLFP